MVADLQCVRKYYIRRYGSLQESQLGALHVLYFKHRPKVCIVEEIVKKLIVYKTL